jgi:ATP-dependent DNA helicase DinG
MNTTLTPTTERAGDRILASGGLISQELPGYEPREPQVRMANLVDETISRHGHALIEAGTGTGKSLAYLIPAILSGEKVVVSTDTIQLQEQLVGKDLPFLAKILSPLLGRPVRFAIAKGRSNYLCERNASTYLVEWGTLDREGTRLAQEALSLFKGGKWNGDKATLKLKVMDQQWSDLAGDDSCTGRSCPFAGTCVYLERKALIEDADIIITNHTMYLLHHYLQQTAGVSVLPGHAIWIADEAHTLSDKAQDVWGLEIAQTRPGSFVKRLQKQASQVGIDLQEVDLSAVQRAAERFFSLWHGAVKDEQLLSEFPEPILAQAPGLLETLVSTLKPVQVAIHHAASQTPPDDKEKLNALAGLKRSADELINGLRAIVANDDPEQVVYAEISADRMGRKQAKLHRKPAETREIFQSILEDLNTAMFTSATLATGAGHGAFAAAADELGMDLGQAETMQVESPFDYARQVIGYLPKGLPEAQSPDYHTAVAEEVIRILNYSLGRAFILFTSNRDMRAVFALVQGRVRFPILLQGSAPKDLLLEEFVREGNAVLFGVKTFWTGVDIRGDALSCVVLVKLPFPNPSSPLVAARCDRIKERGGNFFGGYMLPRCIRDVKQGFGRLIRSSQDEGIFAILDPRMRSKSYGKQIAGSLPDLPVVSEL